MQTPARKPLDAVSHPPDDSTDDSSTDPDPQGAATLRLMLIEDDRTYAWLVQEMLVEAVPSDGLDVAIYGPLADATEETRVVDCALVDLSLPDATGMPVIDAVIASMPDVPF